jgi:radical SAM protein with 4Fe4S-binding SPASM domain
MLNLNYGINLFKAFYAYNHKKVKLDYPPVLGSVEPSSLCNLNCVMCAMDHVTRKRGVMTKETFNNIIHSEATIRTVDFTGHGESLLNRSLEDFIKAVKPIANKVGLTTNATLLTEDRIESLLSAGLDWICFSFEDVNKQVYESIRVGANYEAVESNIKSFVFMKKAMSKSCKTILVVVDSPLTHGSLGKIERKWGPLIDEIKIVPIHDWGGILDSPLVKWKREVRSYPCFEAWYHVYVRWDGSVVPCCLWEGKTGFGNINDQSIMDIWNSETYRSFRESLLYNPVDHCRYCHLDLLGSVFPLGKPEPTFPFSKGSFDLLASGLSRVLRR